MRFLKSENNNISLYGIASTMLVLLALVITGCAAGSPEPETDTKTELHTENLNAGFGEWIIRPIYSFTKIEPFEERRSVAKAGQFDAIPLNMVTDSAGTGAIDYSGKIIIPTSKNVTTYCESCNVLIDSAHENAYNLDGTAAAKPTHVNWAPYYDTVSKQAFIASEGSISYDVNHSILLQRVENLKETKVKGVFTFDLIDGYVFFDGQKTVSDTVYTDILGVSENIAAVKNGKWGFVTVDADTVTPFEFDAVYNFTGEYAPVCKSGSWGFINKTGEFVINPIYQYATPIYDGKAWVKYQGKWGVISLKN